MKITQKFLKNENACSEGYIWFVHCGEREHERVIKKLITENRANWANWCIVRLMTHNQRIQYAIYAAKLVIDNYEKQYPDDGIPRKAIEAAEKYLKNNTKNNRSAARSAAYSAYSAACSVADSARSVADSARSVADSAARSAAYSAYSAARSVADSVADSAARSAADSAARSAADSAYSAAYSATMKTIVEYGLLLLKS